MDPAPLAIYLVLVLGASRILAAQTPAEQFFSAHPVLELRIELSHENLERLRKLPREYLRATVIAPGQTNLDAGLHLKGSGSFRSIDDKPSLTIDFRRFVPNRSLFGLTKIHLNNSIEDPSFLRELVGSELFRAAGVPAPLVGHALVRINGRKAGFYVLKEGFTPEFLARSFPRADGNLYDTDLGHDVDTVMKRHLGKAGAGQEELRALAHAAREPDLSRRWVHLIKLLDTNEFARFVAMELMLSHWDGYALGRNNFRLYHDILEGKSFFLPSGLDQIFTKSDFTLEPQLAGLVARAFLETKEGKELYWNCTRELMNQVFKAQELTKRIQELSRGLEPFLQGAALASFRAETQSLSQAVNDRISNLESQLNQPGIPLLELNSEGATILNWVTKGETPRAAVRKGNTEDGRRALSIEVTGEASVAWQSTVRLKQGRYAFEGESKVLGVKPLTFGKNQGARLRIGGTELASGGLLSEKGWRKLRVTFEVIEPEENVVLLCELRGQSGSAWFDEESLKLRKID